jgi:hypothetical protein
MTGSCSQREQRIGHGEILLCHHLLVILVMGRLWPTLSGTTHPHQEQLFSVSSQKAAVAANISHISIVARLIGNSISLRSTLFNIEEKRDTKISPFFFDFELNDATGVPRRESGFVVRVMKETAMLWQGRRNRRALDKDKLALVGMLITKWADRMKTVRCQKKKSFRQLLLLSGGRKTYWTSSFSWMNRRGLPNTR